MEWILPAISIVLAVFALALLGWLVSVFFKSKEDAVRQTEAIRNVAQQLQSVQTAQDSIKEVVHKSLQTGQQNINQNLQSSQKILSQLNNQIGQLQGTNKQMIQVGNEVKRLQNILSSPKLRGQMGEWSLENMLSQVLPQESYVLQYSFQDGRKVDALVQMNDYSVPIDAKFPLPSFEKVVRAENDSEKSKLRRQLRRDVNSHIDKIADSYIRPAEGTLDFAMMYIPAENIYYETIVKYDGEDADVLHYALERKVIPVSPNLLYAYLMTVAMGLHGMQIEKQAAEIRRNLNELNSDFSRFVNNWDTLGSHIRNASNKYSEAGKDLDRFGLHLTEIQQKDADSPAETDSDS